MRGASAPLRRVVAAYGVNQLGTWFGVVALAVTVYDHTHNAFAVALLFASAQAVPALGVPAFVTFLETRAWRFTFPALYAAEAVLTCLLVPPVLHFDLAAIVVVSALDGLVALSARALLRSAAARAGATDAKGSADAIRRANALMNASNNLTVIVGPAAAGVVVSAAGAPSALLIDAGSFLAAGAVLFGVRIADGDPAAGSMAARLVRAWHHLGTNVELRRLLTTQAFALVWFESAVPVEVLYAKGPLHAGDRGYGLLMGAWGLGLLAGSAVFATWKRPLVPLLAAGTLTIGLSYIGLAFAPSLIVACGAAVIGGAGNGVQWISLINRAQDLTPPALHNRLMGAIEAIGGLVPVLAFAVGGTVAAASSPRVAFAIAGAFAVLASGTFLRLSLGPAARPTIADEQRPVAWESADSRRTVAGAAADRP